MQSVEQLQGGSPGPPEAIHRLPLGKKCLVRRSQSLVITVSPDAGSLGKQVGSVLSRPPGGRQEGWGGL